MLDKGEWYYLRKRILNKILHNTIWKNKPERTLNTMKNEVTYCSHPSAENFIKYTKNYIYSLFSSVSDNADIIMVDQIVPPTNLSRYIRYFNDIKVVIVDRDPRDIFILEKYVWKDGIIPKDVELFCKWFKYTRQHRKEEDLRHPSIYFIQFEDMIYNYDKTTKKLIEWLELEDNLHIRKNKFFIPQKSINNTQTWKKIPCEQKEINYIEKELREYLYLF